ncbi:MAG: type I restriction endonuclease subunit R, partial [Acidobacteriota bacterium]|nr:type I restriction endonuclease subunit R [Acidobacteriota bacterium]
LKSHELPKILIVTEKLLTGYDTPVLYCLYLDKPMRDHILLQAIARVNRPYEDENGRHKPGGFVLDFVGIFENLEKALAFDSQDVSGVIEGVDVLKMRFAEQMKRGQTEYLPLLAGKTGDKAADAALQAFMDDEKKRQGFYQFFRELEDLYEILSPDPFLRDFMGDYQRLADLYALLRAAFEGGTALNRDLARKTAHLVQEHTQGGVIRESIAVYEISPQTLEQLAQSNQPETVKVFNLLKSIAKKVQDEAAGTPYLFSIGERAEQIAERFKQRQLSTQETLQQLEALIQQINQAQREQAASGLSMESFTLGWLLKQVGLAEEAVRNRVMAVMETTLQTYPHWRSSDAQAR